MIETVPAGTILHGRYRIERVLGSGGFGHVYLAVDLTANQQYAVKEYLVSGASGQEQLKHEATVLSHLHHANLPAFQDAFIELGRYYVVLNYIEGNDLTDLVRIARQRNEAIPIFQIINWLLAISDAVMFLHSQKPIVIHRDIKPDNIRITPAGTAILVDLGNAKAAADGARTLFFIRHQGTPGYAPPEQYPGGSGTDARSDVYALGGTLYFALTMQEPPSVSTRNQSLQQGVPTLPSLQEILANNPPEESQEANAARQFRLGVSKPGKPAPRHLRHIAQLAALPPDVLKQLNGIIQKSMALKPKERYAYVGDFANDLKKVAQMIPAPPPPPSRPIDPHSTQPDLPGLYDAIQEARENARQNPPSSPSQQPGTAGRVCPRCGTALQGQATYCPNCGSAVSGPTNIQPTRPAAAKKDISAEQTLLISQPGLQHVQEAVATYTAQPNTGPSTVPVSPRVKGFVGSQHIQQSPTTGPNPARVSPAPGTQQALANKHAPQHPVTDQQAAPPHTFQIGIGMVILVAVILVILIAIAVFLLVSQHDHAQTFMHAAWYD